MFWDILFNFIYSYCVDVKFMVCCHDKQFRNRGFPPNLWWLSENFRTVTILLLYSEASLSGYHVSVLPAEMDIICLVPFRHHVKYKKVKVAHTRLPSVGFRSWSRFLAVGLQVTWVINPAVGCHYFPPGLQFPPQPLWGLLRISLLGEQRHDGCEQFA